MAESSAMAPGTGGFQVVLEILENLRKAVVEYDVEGAASLARKTIEEGIDPIDAADALMKGIRQVGDGFGRGELWLPELVAAADAMQSAMSVVQEHIRRTGKKLRSLGTVVIGTVCGDIHSIGKDMVAALIRAEGFEVLDLGVDVKAEQFVEAVRKHKADIVAMSALLTTTAPEQKKVVESLKEAGLRERVKVMAGGGAITREFAEAIGADGYDPTAAGASRLAKRLVGLK